MNKIVCFAKDCKYWQKPSKEFSSGCERKEVTISKVPCVDEYPHCMNYERNDDYKLLKKNWKEAWKLQIYCKNYLSEDPSYKFDYFAIYSIPHCNSVLEINMDNVKALKCGPKDEIFYYVDCPICGSKIYLREPMLPDYIKCYARMDMHVKGK